MLTSKPVAAAALRSVRVRRRRAEARRPSRRRPRDSASRPVLSRYTRYAHRPPRPEGATSMCGIVGYTGRREAAPILLEGLRRLEYRGYDSAGMVTGTGQRTAPAQEGRAARRARQARRRRTRPRAATASATRAGRRTAAPPTATPTRTSTATATIAVVHNGVIENYAALKQQLQAEGVDVPQRHRHRGDRPADRPLLPRRPGRRRSRRRSALLKGTYGLAVVVPARARA